MTDKLTAQERRDLSLRSFAAVPTVAVRKELLTHNRQDSFKTCRRRCWFEYEIGLRREVDAKALRMGSAWHFSLEAIGKGETLDVALTVASQCYEAKPEVCDETEWAYEHSMVAALLTGYHWRWSESKIEHIATELPFCLSLDNPETGHPTPLFNLAGKIDGIVRLEDNRKAVLEYKLLNDSLDSDSKLWRRLRIDHQIMMYVLAARRLGNDIACVLYDATRKPTIKPMPVPTLDSNGLKVVLDSSGSRVLTAQGKPRQTGDTAKGYVLQTRPMFPREWEEKLLANIYSQPDYYFARHEIPRLDGDLEEYEHELWSIQLALREAQKTGRWYRTSNKFTCSWCPYFDLCTTGYNPQSDPAPEDFVLLDDVHPELLET